MGNKQTDFIIETNGQCFLCLHYNGDNLGLESGNDVTSPNTNQLRSIQCLSRYLKIDMRKVFIGGGPISPHLLAKVRKSKLKVELCEECGAINDKFSELNLQLEKIKMEMNSCLQRILVKLNKTGQPIRSDKSLNVTEMQKIFVERKLEIVEVMRIETKQRCSSKVDKPFPRVRIPKLTKQQENEIELQANRSRYQNEVVGVKREAIFQPNVKIEAVEENSSPPSDYGEDNNFDNLCNEPHSSETSEDESVESNDLGMGQPETETFDEETNKVCPTGAPKSPRQTEGSLREKCIIDSKTNQHTCRDCSRIFTSFPAFYLHYKAEHLKIRYTCSVCNYKCKQIGNFNRHQKVSHKGTAYKCRDCNQIFSLESNLIKHSGSNGCLDRDTVEKSNLAIVRPLKPAAHSWKIQSMCVLNSKSGRYRCKLCKKDLASMNYFREHYNTKHLKIKYKCIPCQKEFSDRGGYKKHQAIHHVGLAYKCPKCSKIFRQKADLNRHLALATCDRVQTTINPETQDQPQRYKCKVCPREFASLSGVTYHHKTVHLKIKDKVKCNRCEKIFQNRSSCKRHCLNSHRSD